MRKNMTEDTDQGEDTSVPIDVESDQATPRDRLEGGAERAVEQLDRSVVDLLAWLLDTETRSRIYVYLRSEPDSTSEEVAEGTGLYPSTVREALAELHEEEIVTREKREHEGAGNNPFAYRAIPPSDLVGRMVSQVQDQLNTLVNLDTYLDDDEPTTDEEPITISVDDPDDREDAGSDDDEADDERDP